MAHNANAALVVISKIAFGSLSISLFNIYEYTCTDWMNTNKQWNICTVFNVRNSSLFRALNMALFSAIKNFFLFIVRSYSLKNCEIQFYKYFYMQSTDNYKFLYLSSFLMSMVVKVVLPLCTHKSFAKDKLEHFGHVCICDYTLTSVLHFDFLECTRELIITTVAFPKIRCKKNFWMSTKLVESFLKDVFRNRLFETKNMGHVWIVRCGSLTFTSPQHCWWLIGSQWTQENIQWKPCFVIHSLWMFVVELVHIFLSENQKLVCVDLYNLFKMAKLLIILNLINFINAKSYIGQFKQDNSTQYSFLRRGNWMTVF